MIVLLMMNLAMALTCYGMRCRNLRYGTSLSNTEHDPEKWKPVFGKDHAQTKGAVTSTTA
jgi:glycerol-3-phosphate dehydrogenase